MSIGAIYLSGATSAQQNKHVMDLQFTSLGYTTILDWFDLK